MINYRRALTLFFPTTLLAMLAAGSFGYSIGSQSQNSEIQQTRADLQRTEEARQTLNNELWEERQKTQKLEEENQELRNQIDEITIDRERIRTEHDITRNSTVELIQGLKSLDEGVYLTLCEQWGRGNLDVEEIVEAGDISVEQEDYFTILLDEACTF